MRDLGGRVNKSFRDRAALAWVSISRGIRYAATGDWEGHEQSRVRRRPPTRLVAQDTDLDFGTREKLISEARDIVQKYGIGKRILRQYANYVVGQCRVQWLTEDEEWNETAEQAFADWSKNPDYKGTLSLRKMARLAIISRKRDGDVFFVERNDGGLYTLEAIEADRVGNIYGQTNIDNERLIGGVHIDSQGRPTAYRILKRGPYGIFSDPVDVPRWKVIHFFDSDRFDAYRGVTAFHVALNDLRDLKESKDAEQLKQKLASKLALLVKNASGKPPTAGVDVFGTDTDAAGNTVTTEAVGDLAIQYQFNGDSFEAFKSDSPGDSWFKLTELIIRDIAIGLDLPYEFVWNMASLTGPGTRMMSKQAERTFVAEQDDLEEQFFSRVVNRWVANEVAEGRLPFNEQAAWWKIQRPSHPSIDAGRDSAANLAELEAGVTSGSSIASEKGEDLYDIHAENERAADDKLLRAKRLSKKHGIDLPIALQLMGVKGAASTMAPKAPENGRNMPQGSQDAEDPEDPEDEQAPGSDAIVAELRKLRESAGPVTINAPHATIVQPGKPKAISVDWHRSADGAVTGGLVKALE